MLLGRILFFPLSTLSLAIDKRSDKTLCIPYFPFTFDLPKNGLHLATT